MSLCAGVGMLDEGARLAFQYLEFEYRPACYVEREIAAARQLVTLMEAGLIDTAPVWSDLVTFRGAEWRGKVDCITAGFPCQPHSVAGKRDGLDDERWLWPDIARIVGDVGPRYVLLENVPGLATTGGLDACIGDLAALGYGAEWGCLSAADVGASHTRERLFIFAWLADTGGARLQGREQRGPHDSRGGGQETHGSVVELRRTFAPGPSDEVWEAYCFFFPFLAPAVESGVCVLADGMALVVDESRTDQLRATGNGVVALTAACAYVQLARRAMKS